MKIKKIIVTIIMAAATMLTPDAIANDIFSELTQFPQVESTYVSGRFAHNMKQWRSSNQLHGFDLSRGFSDLFSYQCYSEESVSKARKILEAYLKANPSIEVMMRQKQGMMTYEIYEKFLSDDCVEQLIIWSQDSPNVCDIVVVDWKDGLKRDVK